MARKKQTFETIVGVVVVVCAATFLTFALRITNTKSVGKYALSAKFQNAEGILVGSDVKVSGIKVGSVTGQEIDKDTYSAILMINVDKDVKIPRDSTARVATSGLIGSKFLDIQPGADDKMLRENEEIRYTQSTIDLEDLISRFVFKGEDDNGKNEE